MGKTIAWLISKIKLLKADGSDVTAPAEDASVLAVKASVDLLRPSSYVVQRNAASTVNANAETLVGSYTVTGSVLYLDSVSVTGTYAAEFRIYLNTLLRQTVRIEVSIPSPEVPFHSMPLQVGDTLEVRVVHYHTGNTHDYESTIKAHR